MLWWRYNPLLLRKVTDMYDYLVLYSSETGNTKQVAGEIFNAIPGTSKDICDIKDFHHDKEAKVYFVGFWTNRGSCDMSIMSLLGGLHNKKVALFGTCGMGKNPEYFHSIANNVSVFIPDDCEYLGSYLCQGRMPLQVRNRYEGLLTANPGEEDKIRAMLQNFDEALTHPDNEDLNSAQTFVSNILGSLGAL